MEIELIHEDLTHIKDWMFEISEGNLDFVTGQILFILPSPIDQYTQKQPNVTFLNMITNTVRVGHYVKSYLLLTSLIIATDYHFSSYPTNSDEFLDWYNERRDNYKNMPDSIKEKLLQENPGTENLSAAHYNRMKNTAESWIECKKKLNYKNQD